MAFASNPGFLAAAFIEASAAFILLLLYWFFAAGFPARFFRYWIVGWSIYLAWKCIHVVALWRGRRVRFCRDALSGLSSACFFAAVCRMPGQGKAAKASLALWLLRLQSVVASLGLHGEACRSPNAGSARSDLRLLSRGRMASLARQSRHRGLGWKLLAGSFCYGDSTVWTGRTGHARLWPIPRLPPRPARNHHGHGDGRARPGGRPQPRTTISTKNCAGWLSSLPKPRSPSVWTKRSTAF